MSDPALSLHEVYKKFGPAEIIRGVNLDVMANERHALIGPNGAGKSTLFNLISGRFAATSGQIRLYGENVAGRTAHRIARKGLSRSFQITNIFNNVNVYHNVRCSVLWACGYRYNFWRNIGKLQDVRERTEEILEMTNLQDSQHLLAGELPYAAQRELEIAITIAGGAKVILLDEPMAGMSVEETERAMALIRTISQGRTLLMVEHDMDVVFDLADRISVLVYGEVIATDTPDRIRGNAAVQAAYLGDGTSEASDE